MRTDILRFSLRCSSFVVFVAYLSLFLGCGDSRQTETNETADKGAISLNVVWPESNTVNLKSSGGRTKALTGNPCVDFNIKTIVATVYTISDTEDTKSPSWDCGERNGTIDKVSPGQMYVVIEAYVGNVDNSPELRGQSDPIQVVAGEENTDLLTNPIKMFPTSDILIWDVGNWDEKNWN